MKFERTFRIMRFLKSKFYFFLNVIIVSSLLILINETIRSIFEQPESIESLYGCQIPNFTFEQVIVESNVRNYICTNNTKTIANHSKFDYKKHLLTINCLLTQDLFIILSPNYVVGRTKGKVTQTGVKRLIRRSPNKFQLKQRQTELNQLLKTIRTTNQIQISILEDELFTVTCNNEEQLFIQTISKPDVEQRIKMILNEKKKQISLPPPVLMLEFDSLSRQHFYRKMPKTTEFIWKNLSVLGEKYTVLDFRKYHSIGLNTDPNLRVILCASGKYGWGKQNSWFKHWWRWCRSGDYIFNIFKENGYATSFGVNLCQDYIQDYFGESEDFHVDHESVTWACHLEYDIDGQWNDDNGPYGAHPRCIDGKYVHTYQIDYIKEFVQNYDSKQLPYVSFASFIEGHERTMQIIGLVDHELKDLIQYLTSSQLKHPPIIFIYSDHGLHYGPMVDQTIAGKMEARLPILLTIIPNQYLTKSSKQILIENQERFTTHRDLYWTLYNIATNSTEKSLAVDDLRRSSLFNKLSTRRDCISEGIPKHLCACSDDGININPDLLSGKID